MTTAAIELRSDEKRSHELESEWKQLRERIAKSPLPELAEILGTKDRSEEDVDELIRRFEAGEFRTTYHKNGSM